ncbi:MAG: motility protein A [Treponema sp.]|jgi:chemotaxis protein MotA|nr:motility protein A [Treponema sp.]
MDIATIIGFVGGSAALVMTVLTSGGTMGGIFDVPSLIFVIGGSFMALMIACPLKQILSLFGILSRSFKVYNFDEKTIIQNLVALSEKARREGILSLEEGLEELHDDFMKNGIRMVVDGVDASLIRVIMENEMSQAEGRHFGWISVLNQWAGLAPGYGMMGTVIGLIGMLNNLEDKSSLGPNMAVALITTLYGSMVANWIMTPISAKLAKQNAAEMLTKEMVVEGVLSIQAGDNPRILGQKLLTYVNPTNRKIVETELGID